MGKWLVVLVMVGGLITLSSSVYCIPVQWSASSGGNDHYYEIIRGPSIDWFGAKSAAEVSTYLGMSGHLVTISSQGEQDFISANSFLGASVNLYGDLVWLGAYQTQDTTAPFSATDPTIINVNSGELAALSSGGMAVAAANDWNWVTGETWGYEGWGVGQPNNAVHILSDHPGTFTDFLSMNANGKVWDDVQSDAGVIGPATRWAYIIEYEPETAVPEPATILLFGTGIAGLITARLKKNRYKSNT